MSIPQPVTHSLNILDISHQQDLASLTVVFSEMKHVKSIFRYVRNLSPGKKVSLTIPPMLTERYSSLLTQAYYSRNGNVRHKTVIKFLDNSLALYAKPCNASSWQLVPANYDAPPLDHAMVPQDVNSEN